MTDDSNVVSSISQTDPARKPAPLTPEQSRLVAIDMARLVRDDKCEDVVLLDVRGRSQITDYVLIGTGTSDRQMHAVIKHLEELGEQRNMRAFRTNTDERSTWLLLDCVNVIAHLFEPNTRAHYDLEMLWGDAPRIEWERPDQMNRDRAGLANSKP